MDKSIKSTYSLSMDESQDEQKPLWEKDKQRGAKLTALIDGSLRSCHLAWQLLAERKALLLVFLSTICYAFRNLGAKVFTEGIDPIQIAVVERTTMMLCCIPVIIVKRYSMKLSGPIFGILSATGVINCLSMTLVVLSFKLINVGDASAIVASKAVFVGFLSWILLTEVPTLLDLAAGVICVLGIIFLSKPTVIFDRNSIYNDDNLYGVLAAVGGTSFAAIATVFKRVLGLKQVQPQIAIFYFSLVSALTSCVFCTAFQKWSWPESTKMSICLIGSGILGYLANVCLMIALSTEKTFHVAIVGSSTIIFVFILQFVFLHVAPDVCSVLGSVFVLTSTIAIAFRKANVDEQANE